MKKNLKATLLLVMVLIMGNTFAQCTKKTDEMTKEVKISTPIGKLGATPQKGMKVPMFLTGKMHAKDGHFFLTFFPEFTDIKTIDEGSIIYVKFDDESVLELKVLVKDIASGATSSSPYAQGNILIWTSTLMTEVSKEDREKLKSKKIAKVRCELNDYVVKGKQQDVIPAWIDCLEKTK